jgi:hypothetical protein
MHLLDLSTDKLQTKRLHTLVVYKLTLSSLIGVSIATILMELERDHLDMALAKTTMAQLAGAVVIGLLTN